MLPLPVYLGPPNLPHQEPVVVSLLRHCFSQTRDRQTPWTQSPHKRRGMTLAKPPSLFFIVQNAETNRQVSILCYFNQNSRRNILPKYLTRYFAKISWTIFYQNIPKNILPKYSKKIFCQNIPPDILLEYPAKYFARISLRYFGNILSTYPTRYLAKIATRI